MRIYLLYDYNEDGPKTTRATRYPLRLPSLVKEMGYGDLKIYPDIFKRLAEAFDKSQTDASFVAEGLVDGWGGLTFHVLDVEDD